MNSTKLNFLVLTVFLILGGKMYASETSKVSIKDKTLIIPMLDYSKDFENYMLKKGKVLKLQKHLKKGK
ncbi:MAG: hypothetical protein H6553_12745 [Chitinophagales bacterium]|nr:hypothetical protein [Chitinophagales bacterium]